MNVEYLLLLVKAECCKTEHYCIPVERLRLRVCTDMGGLITNATLMVEL